MTPKKRFLLGGGGALMPVLISILALDLNVTFSGDGDFSTGNLLGMAIRYTILFIVGGVVAYLHEDETKSFKLFELGIAAPALVTSLITAQGVVAAAPAAEDNNISGYSFLSNAYAADQPGSPQQKKVAGFLSDIFAGVSGQVYRKAEVRHKTPSKMPDQAGGAPKIPGPPPETNSPEPQAENPVTGETESGAGEQAATPTRSIGAALNNRVEPGQETEIERQKLHRLQSQYDELQKKFEALKAKSLDTESSALN